MKKLVMIMPAFLTIVLLLSVINADDDKKPTTGKKNPDNASKPDDSSMVDPDKKCKINFEFKKDMSFTLTGTNTSQTTNTLINSDLTIKRSIKSSRNITNETRKYSILKVEEGKITKFRIDFPEYTVRLGSSLIGETNYFNSDTIYKNQWIEVNGSDPDKYKIEKYSPELASLTTDEENLYKGMMSLETESSGCLRPLGYDPVENILSIQYKPNINYLNSISNKLLFPDYSPGYPVSVGDTWKIKCAEQQKDRKQLYEIVNRKLVGFVDDYHTTLELEFTLKSIKVENDNEYAVLTFKYDYSSPEQSPFTKASKYSYEGMAVHDLTKNRTVFLTVKNKEERMWQRSEFGKYVSQSTVEKTFEYKYDD